MLTETEIRAAKPLPPAIGVDGKAIKKGYKLADGRGLYLFITADGAKSWRMKYVRDGRSEYSHSGVTRR